MLSPHLRKFSAFYERYGLGAVKNVWLLTSLLPIARTVNLYKLKDHVGGVLNNGDTGPGSHYRRLTRFFQDWGGREDFLHDIMRQNLCFLKGMGFKTLVMDGTSWKVGREWFKFLKDKGIHFVIRVRLGDYEAEVSTSAGNAYYKMYLKCAAKDKLVKKQVWLEGQAYTIMMMPNPKASAEEPVLIF